MGVYTLTVLRKDDPVPVEVAFADRAADVLSGIETLLAKHPGCHRIRVDAAQVRLFSVDCHGSRVDG